MPVKRCKKSVILFFFVFISATLGQANWNYATKGSDWIGTCEKGTIQSPVSLTWSADSNPYKTKCFMTDYRPATGVSCNLDHRSFVCEGNFGTLYMKDIDGRAIVYTADQIRFHHKAEHKVNNAEYDLEMQISHKTAHTYLEYNQHIAIVSIFFEGTGGTNSVLEAFDLTDIAVTQKSNLNIDLTSLVNQDTHVMPNVLTYYGSITTPPCTENVNWLIMTDVHKMSSEQLDFFKERWPGGNNRILQTNNPIHQSDESSSEDDSINGSATLFLVASCLLLYVLIFKPDIFIKYMRNY
mmetsp:Transcript_33938/g.38578  ORF Transcript_33938/g.38578 Transcript_33938/m.38578 type:complete len:296 (+) Transcript_33938:50-937(+)